MARTSKAHQHVSATAPRGVILRSRLSSLFSSCESVRAQQIRDLLTHVVGVSPYVGDSSHHRSPIFGPSDRIVDKQHASNTHTHTHTHKSTHLCVLFTRVSKCDPHSSHKIDIQSLTRLLLRRIGPNFIWKCNPHLRYHRGFREISSCLGTHSASTGFTF